VRDSLLVDLSIAPLNSQKPGFIPEMARPFDTVYVTFVHGVNGRKEVDW
jgi:hypothetical protein